MEQSKYYKLINIIIRMKLNEADLLKEIHVQCTTNEWQVKTLNKNMGRICKTGWTRNTQHLEWKKKWTYDFLKWPCHHTRWTYTSSNVIYTEHEHVLWTA